MIIIGEKLNSSIPKTLAAINDCDTTYIIELITSQEKNGAHFLDLNTAICGENELEKLLWLIELVIKNSKCGIMLDSPSPDVINEAIKAAQDRPVIINSVTLTDRIDELLPLIKETGASVVALPIGEGEIPNTSEKILCNAKLIISKIVNYGIPSERIYLDVLAQTLSVCNSGAMASLNAIREITVLFPSVNTICGLSNISFGLPKRVNINCAFLAAAIVAGLDSAILDINSPEIKSTLFSSLVVTGKDEYCMDYISFIRGEQ